MLNKPGGLTPVDPLSSTQKPTQVTILEDFTILDHHLGCIKTVTNQTINLKNPDPKAIHPYDIAASLSKICRFCGHCDEFYSVAQHSILVSLMLPERLRGHGILHDASEAYLGDVVKPLKVILGPVYKELEDTFKDAIAKRFHWLPPLTKEDESEIKKCDILALQVEDEAFRKGNKARMRYYYEKYDLMQSEDQLGWPPRLALSFFLKYAKIFL